MIGTKDNIDIKTETIQYRTKDEMKIEILKKYDKNTNITTKTTSCYNKDDNLILIICKEDDIEIRRAVIQYYDNGERKSVILKEYDKNDSIATEITTEYRDDGTTKETLELKFNKYHAKIFTYTTKTTYDKDGKPISELYTQKTDNYANDIKKYRSATFINGTCIAKDHDGKRIKYNNNPDYDIAFASINSNGKADITDQKNKDLCEAINKQYKNKIADIHVDTINKETIDGVINDKLKNNQTLLLNFEGHQVCVAKIEDKLFSVGIYHEKYKPKQKVEDISLVQSSRNSPCVNLAEIMTLFSAKWINNRKGANQKITADDFRKAINEFAKDYQNEKLYDWYANEVMILRYLFKLPDFVEQNMNAASEYNKLSDDDKKNTKEPTLITNHKLLSSGGSKDNNYGFLGNASITIKNNSQDLSYQDKKSDVDSLVMVIDKYQKSLKESQEFLSKKTDSEQNTWQNAVRHPTNYSKGI